MTPTLSAETRSTDSFIAPGSPALKTSGRDATEGAATPSVILSWLLDLAALAAAVAFTGAVAVWCACL